MPLGNKKVKRSESEIRTHKKQKYSDNEDSDISRIDKWDNCNPKDLDNPRLFINRELSALEFNKRVLEQVEDPSIPLLERIRFLAIVGITLDEFFMIRLAYILQRIESNQEHITPDGVSSTKLFLLIREKVQYFLKKLSECWKNILCPLLAKENIFFIDRKDYDDRIRGYLSNYFHQQIHAVLTPLALDPAHPFPHISNLSLNLAVAVEHNNNIRFARIKIPSTLPRFIQLPQVYSKKPGYTFVFLEDIIKDNIQALFRDVKVVEVHIFRVIRDTQLNIEESEIGDIREKVDQELKQLPYRTVNLLEVQKTMPQYMLDILIENFHVSDEIIPKTMERMGFGDWFQLLKIPEARLKFSTSPSKEIFEEFSNANLLDQIKHQDYLVHHPYQSFDSVVRFVKTAVNDPKVLAIKLTLYRVDAKSKILEQLIKASQSGKQVSVLVELQARFDEHNNINLAKKMEEHGIYVAYGLLNLKTHCKLCLVVREEKEGVRSYAHIGTGNYNWLTAKHYVDLGLFTSNPKIIEDIIEIFNLLTGYSNPKHFNHLLVAPHNLRDGIKSKIEREIEYVRAGKPGHLIFQFNGLEDQDMIKLLIKASQAGLRIDLIVRGICCLRPNIPGISENIRVISIIGRFLEHSRVYYFLNGGKEEILIGSADLMNRNLNLRIETLCPVLSPIHRKHIRYKLLETVLEDNQRAYLLNTDGSYTKVNHLKNTRYVDSHKEFLKHYAETIK